VESQRGIAHQGSVDHIRGKVDLGLVDAGIGVVLRQSGAVSDGFTESHGVEKPVGHAGVHRGQAIGGRGEHGAGDVVLSVPVAAPTAEQHHEDGADIAADEVSGRGVVVGEATADA